MAKSTISVAIFNSYVKLPEGRIRHFSCLSLLELLKDVEYWSRRWRRISWWLAISCAAILVWNVKWIVRVLPEEEDAFCGAAPLLCSLLFAFLMWSSAASTFTSWGRSDLRGTGDRHISPSIWSGQATATAATTQAAAGCMCWDQIGMHATALCLKRRSLQRHGLQSTSCVYGNGFSELYDQGDGTRTEGRDEQGLRRAGSVSICWVDVAIFGLLGLVIVWKFAGSEVWSQKSVACWNEATGEGGKHFEIMSTIDHCTKSRLVNICYLSDLHFFFKHACKNPEQRMLGSWLFKFKPGGAVCESDPKGCMPACEGQRSSNATCHTLPRGMCKGSYVVIDAWPSPRNG